MNETRTQVDRLISKIKNNPILAFLIVLGSIAIALSAFTDAARNLLGLVIEEKRPAINGEWKAEVTYDWKNAKYIEIFTFKGEGEEVYGTASFLRLRRGILEGKIKKDTLEFITKTQEVLGPGEPRVAIHHYRGRLLGDEINFSMQTEGGYSEHIPVEFIAKRVPNKEIQPTD